MRWTELIYLLFAVVHPVSELLGGTNLRIFLNKDYYGTNRDDFPVSRLRGVGGSLAVLVFLVIPFLGLDWGVDWWNLAFGLAVADVIQHAVHFVRRPQEAAPKVHLITILVVLGLMLVDHQPTLSGTASLGSAIFGALLILGNWGLNSLLVSRAQGAKPMAHG